MKKIYNVRTCPNCCGSPEIYHNTQSNSQWTSIMIKLRCHACGCNIETKYTTLRNKQYLDVN